MSHSKSDEILRLEENVRLAEKGGQKDTVHHQNLAKALGNAPEPVDLAAENKALKAQIKEHKNAKAPAKEKGKGKEEEIKDAGPKKDAMKVAKDVNDGK